MHAYGHLATMGHMMGNVILGMFIVAAAALFFSCAGFFLVAGTDEQERAVRPGMPR